MSGRVRVFLAISLDGYVAGPNDDLGFLDAPHASASPLASSGALSFEAFMADIGCLLMGRRTYDVVTGMGVPWPYGETAVLVATQRPLDPVAATVRAARGSIDQLLDEALEAAKGQDVYLDGADLVRQALDADRVDELILTYVPVLLGGGTRLFDGISTRKKLVFHQIGVLDGGLVQLRAR